ncbi:MAG: hypothetical protein EOP46_17395, partial [Sphingobacteriaceae bacterium]
MKLFLLFFLTCIFLSVSAQNMPFDSLLKKGKEEFYNSSEEKPGYNSAIKYLEAAVKLNPNSSEAYYFLGYAYSRKNSFDGRSIGAMQLNLVIKASEALERVIKLTPLYTGESVVLDPYSKISSEWGSLALSYYNSNKIDSAKWAFTQGKKRGGFDDFILSVNREIIKSCTQKAILITSGDNYTLPLHYLQIVEGLRKDVSLIDVSLLNTVWYPQLLISNSLITFDEPKSVIDTVEYRLWKEKIITISDAKSNKKFSWLVKPAYEKQYMLR